MKEKQTDPAYLIEMPHTLRHLIMKRGHLLRSRRTKSVATVSQRGDSSWLQARLKSEGKERQPESWDTAHELASLIKRELHHEAFVEPATKAGRYQDILAAEKDPLGGDSPSAGGSPEAFSHGPGLSGAGFASGVSGFPGQSQVVSPFANFGIPASSTTPSVPSLNNMLPGLPKEARDSQNAQINASCPALRKIAGWSELPVNIQQRYEAEAAQTIKSGLSLTDLTVAGETSQHQTLLLLSKQEKISRALRTYLEAALGAA